MRLLRSLSALLYCSALGVLMQRALHNRTTFPSANVHIAASASSKTRSEICHVVQNSQSLTHAAMLFKEIQDICPAAHSIDMQWSLDRTIQTTVALHPPRAIINRELVFYGHGFAPTSLFAPPALNNLPIIKILSSCLEHPACMEQLTTLLAITNATLWDMFDVTLTTTSLLTLTDKNDSRLSLLCQLHQMPSVSLCATAQTLFHDLENIFSFENPEESLIIDTRFSGRLIVSQAGGNHGTYETRTTDRCH